MLKQLFHVVLILLLMAGCSVLPTMSPSSENAALQMKRIADAENDLDELETIEAVVKLNNSWLGKQIETVLQTRALQSEQFRFRRLKLDFGRQAIMLEALVDVGDDQDQAITVSVSGEIQLDFTGKQLEWFPLIRKFDINGGNFIFGEGADTVADPGITAQLRQDFNRVFVQSLIDERGNLFPLDTVPLAEIGVGASLPGLSDTPASQVGELRGVFLVNGSATLIDSQATTIALDLFFIPDLSTCPADVSVSRAGFTRDVESREPVGMLRSLGNSEDIRYFYSEIKGAKQPLTIIHYWFADGSPMAIEELPVDPSYRWRTWSGRGQAGADASRWEVLVVEKNSGCILHSQTISAPEPEVVLEPAENTLARHAFNDLEARFTSLASTFSIIDDKPDIALIEVKRNFYGEVLRAAMADLSLNARFDSARLAQPQFDASLSAFDASDITCERRECSPPAICKANLSQCKRLRDTRDCTTCQFRNPLNNRCVSEVKDPLCEASRERQNRRYDAERAACIADAETLKRECDELAEQTLRSCQIESGFEGSTCEVIKTSMRGLDNNEVLAHVSTRVQVSGSLQANFSNFQVVDDLQSLKLDIALQPNLQLDGTLEFTTAGVAEPLAECILAWGAPYTSRMLAAPSVKNLLNDFEDGGDQLTANWSGFGITTSIRPSPLRAVFVANPNLLANCKIGLTRNKVEQSITGQDAEFFTGAMELQVLPLPTVIRLASASIVFGENSYSAKARLSESHLRYDIEE